MSNYTRPYPRNRPDMREQITFLSPPTSQDSYGAPSGTWTTFSANVFASLEPLLGNEYIQAQATQSSVQVKFRCYWFTGVADKMRIQHGTDIYEILSSINVKSFNRELLCYCKKVV